MYYDILVSLFAVLAQFFQYIFSIDDYRIDMIVAVNSTGALSIFIYSQSNDILLLPKLGQATFSGLLGSIMPIRSKKRGIHTPRSWARIASKEY